MSQYDFKPSCGSCEDGSCPDKGHPELRPCADYIGYRPPAKPERQTKWFVLRPKPGEDDV